MAVKTLQYANNLASDTYRRGSPVIWSTYPGDQHILERGGQVFFDDFNPAGQAVMTSAYKNSLGQWSVYADAGALLQNGQDTSGTVADAEGGWITIGSDGDNEG